MVGIIIASHGDFCQGILQSATMIAGEQDHVEAVPFHSGQTTEALKAVFDQTIKQMNTPKILFLVDLFGGTPFNTAVRIASVDADNVAVVTGLNLPMLMEAYFNREMALPALVSHLEQTGRSGIKHFELPTDESEDELL
ncbi:PTS sugar transporter subunit IIA [Lactiplantibacillus garii]|uniref:PTS sugar transporter subunit IIA n=1 Tax=Lactiplantibacillus garii TaxID=2306423 RepID=UPI001315908C|nr:PTS sugar transporter subunit IIA [Lactiplantibacillus garii]